MFYHNNITTSKVFDFNVLYIQMQFLTGLPEYFKENFLNVAFLIITICIESAQVQKTIHRVARFSNWIHYFQGFTFFFKTFLRMYTTMVPDGRKYILLLWYQYLPTGLPEPQYFLRVGNISKSIKSSTIKQFQCFFPLVFKLRKATSA